MRLFDLRSGRVPVRWPALLMVATLAVTAGALWEAARAARSERATADETLSDYASFAAWAMGQRSQREIEQLFWSMLGPEHMGGAVHRAPPVPTARNIAHNLPWDYDCYCHRVAWAPSAFLALTLGRDSLEVAPNLYAGTRPGVIVDANVSGMVPLLDARTARVRAVPPGERKALIADLTRDARTTYRDGWGLGVLVRSTPQGPALVGYTLMPTAWGDTLLYAVTLDAPTTRALVASVARDSLLPTALASRPAGGVDVAVSVRTATGAPVFTTDPPPIGRWTAATTLPATAGALTVKAGLPSGAARDLLIGGLPTSRLPVLGGLLLLAIILAAVAATQMRRSAELARARADFISSVSHELRTPLAQVRLYLETLRLGRFRTEEQREQALETIDRETLRLGSLVDNVLYFDRAVRGAERPAAMPIDIAEEARSAVAAFEPLARAQNMAIDVVAQDGAVACVDPQELRQVFANLLDNAAKYGPTGQQIGVSVTRVNGGVEIDVTDAGPGVPTTERAVIWEAFRRGSVGQGGAAGSGIGLAVVREIIERHGGRVAVADAQGGGARFHIQLPAVGPEP